MMEQVNGHGRGPQMTAVIPPPATFYGDEMKDVHEFDVWLVTVTDYV